MIHNCRLGTGVPKTLSCCIIQSCSYCGPEEGSIMENNRCVLCMPKNFHDMRKMAIFAASGLHLLSLQGLQQVWPSEALASFNRSSKGRSGRRRGGELKEVEVLLTIIMPLGSAGWSRSRGTSWMWPTGLFWRLLHEANALCPQCLTDEYSSPMFLKLWVRVHQGPQLLFILFN